MFFAMDLCLRDLLQVMESRIESGFQELNGRLGSLEARMSAIEKTQADFLAI